MIHVLIPTTVERRTRLAECVATIHEFAGVPHIISTYENYHEGFVAPIKKLLRDLKPETLVFCIGDDTRFIEPNTLNRLEGRYYLAYPNRDGVVNPDDGIQHGSIITMPLCTAKTMLENGVHDGFFLNFCDNLFTDIMKKKDRYTYCPEVKVEHQHHVNKKAPLDETYSYAQSRFHEDRELYVRLKHQMGV